MKTIMIVGAGIMGLGIAQIAAQNGDNVKLFVRNDGAAKAKAKLATLLDTLVTKGKIEESEKVLMLDLIEPISSLSEGREADVVIEAIVEDVATKREMLKQIEMVVSPQCIIATNTSSISITTLANGMLHPSRLVGMHFFNPVPLMKLVEIISGMHTDPFVASEIEVLTRKWGKTPVHGKSTPGFIVNRIARPYYAEALALIQETAATPAVIDACLRAVGFKMGPCELMDLIGHDTNFAVTSTIYAANFYDKRFVPSLVQQELVDGGLFGRKSGRGFYTYPGGAPELETVSYEKPSAKTIELYGSGPIMDYIAAQLIFKDYEIERFHTSAWSGLIVDKTNCLIMSQFGQTSQDTKVSTHQQTRYRYNVATFDKAMNRGGHIAYSIASSNDASWNTEAPAWLAIIGFIPHQVADTPGLIVSRTLAMLINEAADAVRQGVCTIDGANTAMKLGVNYPKGPFEWLADWGGNDSVNAVLESLDHFYRGERYRTSPLLLESVYD